MISSMLVRMYLAMIAIVPMPSAKDGMIVCQKLS